MEGYWLKTSGTPTLKGRIKDNTGYADMLGVAVGSMAVRFNLHRVYLMADGECVGHGVARREAGRKGEPFTRPVFGDCRACLRSGTRVEVYVPKGAASRDRARWVGVDRTGAVWAHDGQEGAHCFRKIGNNEREVLRFVSAACAPLHAAERFGLDADGMTVNRQGRREKLRDRHAAGVRRAEERARNEREELEAAGKLPAARAKAGRGRESVGTMADLIARVRKTSFPTTGAERAEARGRMALGERLKHGAEVAAERADKRRAAHKANTVQLWESRQDRAARRALAEWRDRVKVGA